ncbi:MAG: phage holin [Oscillospiraceae bacterium]|nr:phage holin [Oscillospiraceae bacterium]
MNVSKETIARTVVLLFALVNQFLTIFGWNPLPFSNDAVYEAVSMLATVGASLWAWWKNNSFTPAAIAADKMKDELKAGEKK